MPLYVNVYDDAGRPLIVARAVPAEFAERAGEGGCRSMMARLYYEHGLVKPDYDVYRTRDAAEAEAARLAGS